MVAGLQEEQLCTFLGCWSGWWPAADSHTLFRDAPWTAVLLPRSDPSLLRPVKLASPPQWGLPCARRSVDLCSVLSSQAEGSQGVLLPSGLLSPDAPSPGPSQVSFCVDLTWSSPAPCWGCCASGHGRPCWGFLGCLWCVRWAWCGITWACGLSVGFCSPPLAALDFAPRVLLREQQFFAREAAL